MSPHFTATVDITKTTPPGSPASPTATYRHADRLAPAKVASAESREVEQLARLTIRASSLEGLREKLAGHVALIGGDE